MNDIAILVVEDEPMVLLDIEAALAEAGFDTITRPMPKKP